MRRSQGAKGPGRPRPKPASAVVVTLWSAGRYCHCEYMIFLCVSGANRPRPDHNRTKNAPGEVLCAARPPCLTHGARSRPQLDGPADTLADVGLGQRHGVGQREPLRQQGGGRGGERAARAVRVGVVEAVCVLGLVVF